MLDGLPKLLSIGIGNVPGPVGFMNGVIQGLADSYIPTMTDEQLSITLSFVIGELNYWLHGQPVESETPQIEETVTANAE